jgi:hypothetical protein
MSTKSDGLSVHFARNGECQKNLAQNGNALLSKFPMLSLK